MSNGIFSGDSDVQDCDDRSRDVSERHGPIARSEAEEPAGRRSMLRKQFLQGSLSGLGGIALNWMLNRDSTQASDSENSDRRQGRPRNVAEQSLPHFRGQARSVIWLFMEGGPSHLDLLDPKPLLNRLAGQPLPDSFREPITAMGEKRSPLLASPRRWRQHGQSGLWASDWIPEIGSCLDDIAVIRSCWTNGINHAGGVCQMNTCLNVAGRPSLGAWVNYGLGSANDSLPSFAVLCDSQGRPVNGTRNWGSGFMPATFQGVHLQGAAPENAKADATDSGPIRNLKAPKGISAKRQEQKLRLLNSLNRLHAETRSQQSELEARINSYELAFRMQAHAPEAVDLSEETEVTRKMYGLDDQATSVFGRNCLLARRLVERGVRFIQLYSGTGSKWDSHSDIEANHSRLCRSMDLPVAGLLRDLKQRGLLETTLVVWGGEFGRTPMSEKGNGRDHNPTGFSIWMAGGGVRGGQVIGATDELGLYATEDRMHVRDIHASILGLMGLDHMQLTWNHHGRLERPTINEGSFQQKLVW